MDEVIGLFATPFLRVTGLLDPRLVAGLVERFTGRAHTQNNASGQLSHTEMSSPATAHCSSRPPPSSRPSWSISAR